MLSFKPTRKKMGFFSFPVFDFFNRSLVRQDLFSKKMVFNNCSHFKHVADLSSLPLNPVNIQLLPKELHVQLFPSSISKTTTTTTTMTSPTTTTTSTHTKNKKTYLISIAKQHLAQWNIQLNKTIILPEPRFPLPSLQGKTIAHHFFNIGQYFESKYTQFLHPYLKLNLVPSMIPSQFVIQSGWTHYPWNSTQPITSIPFPKENILTFDIEVLYQVHSYPIMATALGSNGFYVWISPWLLDPFNENPEQLIPLGNQPYLVIGHNVSFDRKAILEEYSLKPTRTSFLDTMSLHNAVHGMSTQQLHEYEEFKKINAHHSGWLQHATLSSLADLSEFYLNQPLNKSPRDFFSSKEVSLIQENLQPLLHYCAVDTFTTYQILQKLYPKFNAKCPHPISFMGSVFMNSCYLPVSDSWSTFLQSCDQTVKTWSEKIEDQLLSLAFHAIQLYIDQSEAIPMLSQPLYPSFPLTQYQTESLKLKTKELQLDPWLSQLDWTLKPLKLTKKGKPFANQVLPNYPAWFIDLWDSKLKKITISQRKQVTPLLLQLKWRTFPLIFSDTYKWGYMVPPDQTPDHGHEPMSFLNEFLLKKETHSFEACLSSKYNYPSQQQQQQAQQEKEKEKDKDVKQKQSSSEIKDILRFEPWLKQGYTFYRLPHNDGKDKNLGSPFSKHNLTFFENQILHSEHPTAKEAVLQQAQSGYWVTSSDRLKSQFVVWKSLFPSIPFLNWDTATTATTTNHDSTTKQLEKDVSSLKNKVVSSSPSSNLNSNISTSTLTPSSTLTCNFKALNPTDSTTKNKTACVSTSSSNVISSPPNQKKDYGAILPGIIVMGTLTRRAVEPTWMTASNAKKLRIGSDVKRFIEAPPGYAIVGADVDAEELWILCVLGDAYFKVHGATVVSWRNLQGQKSDGTDLHSVSAQILGISRDAAKQFNYARYYGAGESFATQLLLKHNPQLTFKEASSRTKELYEKTKGKTVPLSIRKLPGAPEHDYSTGGTETFMFNCVESIARSKDPRTPTLKCQIPDSMLRDNCKNKFMRSRINWVVQSSGVDYLHLLIMSMAYLIEKYDIQARLMLTIHDDIRYLVKEEDKYRAALALQISNLWTRTLFVHQLGFQDLPLSVAFFSGVDIDHCLRKETNDPCITPTNSIPVPPGETLTIYDLIDKLQVHLGQEQPLNLKKYPLNELFGPVPIERKKEWLLAQIYGDSLEESSSSTNKISKKKTIKEKIDYGPHGFL